MWVDTRGRFGRRRLGFVVRAQVVVQVDVVDKQSARLTVGQLILAHEQRHLAGTERRLVQTAPELALGDVARLHLVKVLEERQRLEVLLGVVGAEAGEEGAQCLLVFVLELVERATRAQEGRILEQVVVGIVRQVLGRDDFVDRLHELTIVHLAVALRVVLARQDGHLVVLQAALEQLVQNAAELSS